MNQSLVMAGPRLGGKTSFLFGEAEALTIEKGTFLSMLVTYLFEEVFRETTTTAGRSLDIAVKLGVIDCLHRRPALTPYDREGT